MLLRLVLVGFVCSVSLVLAEPSLFGSPNDRTSISNLQKHRERLEEEDLSELTRDLETYRSHAWLPGAIETVISQKKTSLHYLNQAPKLISEKFDPLRATVTSMQDVQVLIGTRGEPPLIPRGMQRSVNMFPLADFAVRPPQVRVKVLVDGRPLGLHFLESIGDTEIVEFVQRYRGDSTGPVRGLPNLPYLSRLIEVAEKLAGSVDDELFRAPSKTSAHLEAIAVTLASESWREVYENPQNLSDSWMKEDVGSEGQMPSAAQQDKQLKLQQTLVSTEDRDHRPEVRAARWQSVLDRLVKAYHSDTYRRAAMSDELGEVVAVEDDPSSCSNFVSNFGVELPEELPDEVNLSALFLAPRLQGNSNACVAFSLMSDMERFESPALSTGLAYALFKVDSLFFDRIPSKLREFAERTWMMDPA